MVISHTRFPRGLQLVEVDESSALTLAEVVVAANNAGQEFHIDVSRLSLRDTSGIAALVGAGQDSPAPGGRIIVHGLPAKLVTTLKTVGWDQHIGLFQTDDGIA